MKFANRAVTHLARWAGWANMNGSPEANVDGKETL
jgi:hypothetical protein